MPPPATERTVHDIARARKFRQAAFVYLHVVFARVVWVVHGPRLPSLIPYAFFSTTAGALTRGFYDTAIVVVVINLWMLARAAWDL